MKAKKRTAAQAAEDCLVYDKPVTVQRYTAGSSQDAEHLHANINKAVVSDIPRFLFRFRYYSLFDEIRLHPQIFRLICFGETYSVADYDDYNERHRVIKLTAERMNCSTLNLISETRSMNDRAQFVTEETASENVFCTVSEYTEAEWNGAQQRGYDAEVRLNVFASDYAGQRICKWQDTRYEIYRRTVEGDMIALYLGRRVGV